MTSGRRNIQSACLVCGASLPHTTPMSREYHENVARRSQGEYSGQRKQHVYQEKEIVQGSEEIRELEQAGWHYFRTYHDGDKASATYGKRIDIYLLKSS